MLFNQTMRILSLLLIGLIVSSCGQSGKIYPLAIDDAHELLTSSSQMDILVTPGVVFNYNSSASSQNMVVWDASNDDQSVFRFKALLHPENALSTRVSVKFEGTDSPAGKKAQERLIEHSSIHALYQAAAEEAVGAKLERRSFNFAAIQSETMSAVASNIHSIAINGPPKSGKASNGGGGNDNASYIVDNRSSSSPYSRRDASTYSSSTQYELDQRVEPSVNLDRYNRGY